MGKSNKELAVELTIAIINANPRTVYKKTQVSEDVVPALSAESIQSILTGTYRILESLDKNQN